MSDPASQPDLTECLFSTILGFTLPFYLAGAGGNVGAANKAVVELVAAYGAVTAPELDLVGRLVGFSAAAMDNLRLSMQADLSDAKVLHYRGNAVALGRLAEQCRKALEAMQTKREQASATRPMPQPRPAPVAPPKPPLPPREMPPAQPQASTPMVEDDPQFTYDIETMKRNARAMIADLQARGRALGPDSPEASIAWMELERNKKDHPTGRAVA
ncbi:hypothetical protein [Acidisphaera sp. S103]|uniref:hypothetical protein n=1 Tax=Acidisphaera sp. S103 TaxID=1747223 RepID=UPI00131BAAC6|nr:hypothetical protein [Acidisphaera sp. S103]